MVRRFIIGGVKLNWKTSRMRESSSNSLEIKVTTLSLSPTQLSGLTFRDAYLSERLRAWRRNSQLTRNKFVDTKPRVIVGLFSNSFCLDYLGLSVFYRSELLKFHFSPLSPLPVDCDNSF